MSDERTALIADIQLSIQLITIQRQSAANMAMLNRAVDATREIATWFTGWYRETFLPTVRQTYDGLVAIGAITPPVARHGQYRRAVRRPRHLRTR